MASIGMDFVDFFGGCIQGAVSAGMTLMKLIYTILKSATIWNIPKNAKTKYQEVSESMESVLLYLSNEYDRAYEEASPPFRSIKAARGVGSFILGRIFNNISDHLSEGHQKFQCMNLQARTRMICQLAGEFLMPPITAVAVFKWGLRGSKGLKTASLLPLGREKALRIRQAIKGQKNAKSIGSVKAKNTRRARRARNAEKQKRAESIAKSEERKKTNKTDLVIGTTLIGARVTNASTVVKTQRQNSGDGYIPPQQARNFISAWHREFKKNGYKFSDKSLERFIQKWNRESPSKKGK